MPGKKVVFVPVRRHLLNTKLQREGGREGEAQTLNKGRREDWLEGQPRNIHDACAAETLSILKGGGTYVVNTHAGGAIAGHRVFVLRSTLLLSERKRQKGANSVFARSTTLFPTTLFPPHAQSSCQSLMLPMTA